MHSHIITYCRRGDQSGDGRAFLKYGCPAFHKIFPDCRSRSERKQIMRVCERFYLIAPTNRSTVTIDRIQKWSPSLYTSFKHSHCGSASWEWFPRPCLSFLVGTTHHKNAFLFCDANSPALATTIIYFVASSETTYFSCIHRYIDRLRIFLK